MSLVEIQQTILLLLVWLIPIGIWSLLVVPPAFRARSWETFARIGLVVGGAMGLPLFAFLMAILMAPMSKAAATFGAFDSFQFGKVALVPLLLWSLVACYLDVASPTTEPVKSWITLGLGSGFVIHTAWMGHAIIVHHRGELILLSPVLLVAPAWYAWRVFSRFRQASVSPRAILFTVAGSLPFWIYSVVLSKRHHADLPEVNDCFVVTAASHGHRQLVGASIQVRRRGQTRVANTQLATFWTFEDCWQSRSPSSHRLFRKIYGVLGPAVASRVTGPLRADLMYIGLKPIEHCARLFLLASRLSSSEQLDTRRRDD